MTSQFGPLISKLYLFGLFLGTIYSVPPLRLKARGALTDHGPALARLARIDAVLDNMVARSWTKKGSKLGVKLGDRDCDVMVTKDADGVNTSDPAFRLYMQTKLPNPHYIPEIQAQTTLVNFTVTEKGLEDQLLATVVGCERPDLLEEQSDLT